MDVHGPVHLVMTRRIVSVINRRMYIVGHQLLKHDRRNMMWREYSIHKTWILVISEVKEQIYVYFLKCT